MKSFHLIVFALCIVACGDQEDFDTNTSLVNVITFKSHEELNSIATEITGMDENQFASWEQKNSFQSFRTIFIQAEREWKSIATEQEQISFLQKYSDILTYKDSVLIPAISIPLYQSIANREGLYITDGYVNKVVGDYIVSARIEEYQKLKLIDGATTISDNMSVRSIRFKGVDTKASARTNANCETEITAEYFKNGKNCRHDRKVILYVKSYLVVSTTSQGVWRTPRVLIEVTGRYRTGTFCRWLGQYDEPFSYRNVSFTIMAWETQNGVGVPKLFSYALPDRSETSYIQLRWNEPIGSSLLNQPIVAQPFNTIYAEASSRGTDDNWAVMDCQ